MSFQIYVVFTVSQQEFLYEGDLSNVEFGFGGLVAWCLALTIAVALFLFELHRTIEQGSVKRGIGWVVLQIGGIAALGTTTGYLSPPVFIRNRHVEYWAIYTVGVCALILALGLMASREMKKPAPGGSDRSNQVSCMPLQWCYIRS